MEKEQLDKLNALISENKGKRKFVQSVDLSVNFTGIDFSKQDNRLNMQITLPNGRGKTSDVIFFGDDANLAAKAQQAGAKVVPGREILDIASDKTRMADLLNHELIAQPALMPQIAKALGQFLGPRNKMPKPVIGTDVSSIIKGIGGSIYVRSKGKYLPTAHCVVGNESMDVNAIATNVDEVIGAFTRKVGRPHIKSAYIKLTMSKPVKLI
jgi:large subunit ribosomal protein L1